MFKFPVAKIIVSCCQRLRCSNSGVYTKITPFWRNIHAEKRTCVSVTSFGCRLYAKQVPRVDVEVQADDIWTNLCHTNRLPVIDVQNSKGIIKFLLSLHYHKKHILRELSENPALLKFPMNKWTETVSSLQSYGFQEPHFLPLLAGCHELLHGTEWNNLQETLIFLHSLQIPERKRLQVIARNPLLMTSSDTRPIMKKYSNLLRIFTKNEAQMLIVQTPNILTDEISETNAKIDYVYNEMGIRSLEMTRSRVLEHSLAHIITRHQFAQRAGAYKTPDKHEIAAKQMKPHDINTSANPSLSDLVDTSNSEFVQSFCGTTVAEYKAFEAMMEEELRELSESEDDTDNDLSDSDSESE